MMKRIFVAIDISDEARARTDAYLQNLRRDFRDLRVGWEKREKLHLTLKFIGDIDDDQLTALVAAVENTAARVSPFRLQIARTGQFEKRVLWLGVADPDANLSKIHERLETDAARAGFVREARRFNPHLTIARLREPAKSARLIEAHLENEFASVAFEVSEVVVYESKPGTGGSNYQRIKAVRLTKPLP